MVPVAKGLPQFAMYHDTPKTQKSGIEKAKDVFKDVKSGLFGSELLQTETQAEFSLGELSKQVVQTGHD